MEYKTNDVKNMYKIIEKTDRDSMVRKVMQKIVQDYNVLYAEYSSQQEELKRNGQLLTEIDRLHKLNKNRELSNNRLKAYNEKLEKKLKELEDKECMITKDLNS